MRKVLITGGYGFIGGNLVNYWGRKYPEDHIFVLDSQTYAANPEYVTVPHEESDIDIRDQSGVSYIVETLKPDLIIHLAAESHVCKSIEGPKDFFETNVMGTFNLLHAFKELKNGGRFLYMSTDEIFGEVENGQIFNESSPIKPRSPYSASKAGGDHVAKSYFNTYGVDVVIANAGNNFGPGQHKEKFIPRIIEAVQCGKPITIYGHGSQIRDWIYIDDTLEALDLIALKGVKGERYCISGNMQLTNVALAKRISNVMLVKPHIIHTNDRPTDDKWYASDASKLIKKLKWTKPRAIDFNSKLLTTISWYNRNSSEVVRSLMQTLS